MASTVVTGNRSSTVTIGSNEFYINKSMANHDTSADPSGFGVRVEGQDHYLRIDGDLTGLVWAIDLATTNAVDTDIRISSGAKLNSTFGSGVTIGSSLAAGAQISQQGPTIINSGNILSQGSAAINLNFVATELRNTSNGVINGTQAAIIVYDFSTVINDGEIYANGGWAIKSNGGSTVRNLENGYIEHNNSNGSAIEVARSSVGTDGRLFNSGYIGSNDGNAVNSVGAKVYNYQDIYGAQSGILAEAVIGFDFIVNSGTISGGNYAIDGASSELVRIVNSGTIEDEVRTGDGNDSIVNTGTIEDDVSMGAGNDRFDNSGGTITGGPLSVIDLGAGDDIFIGSSGTSARIEGGSGNDRFYGGDARDTFEGGSGDDIFFTGAGIDSARAGEGNDKLYGQGSDTKILFGGFGDDFIFGGDGDDVISGGNASPLDFSAGVEVEGVDRIYAGGGNDQIHGDGGDDFIYGGEGNDFIIGGYGNDRLYGQNGDDDFLRDFGDDFIVGGAGTDEVSYTGFNTTDFLIQKDAVTGVVTVATATEASSLFGTDTLVGVEFLIFDNATIDVASL